MKFIAAIIFATTCLACSNKGLYDAFQHSEYQQCNKLPSPQNEECEEKSRTDYQDYKQQRKEAMENPE